MFSIIFILFRVVPLITDLKFLAETQGEWLISLVKVKDKKCRPRLQFVGVSRSRMVVQNWIDLTVTGSNNFLKKEVSLSTV